ncbi:MAG: response regulator, partial [Algicola sp.]|nr:response regulator [Algicola sp.]
HLLDEQADNEADNPPKQAGTANSDGRQFRILLVDDEPINRKVLYNHLSMCNYQLVEAATGKQALDLVNQSEPFDLVLLDIMMPKMSGYEVCKKLRENFGVHDLPVIFLTAKNQVADLVESFAVGANDYLSKPVSKHELLSRVETHLRLLDINRNLENKVAERTARLQLSNQKISALNDICAQISSSLELDKLMKTAYDHIKTLMEVDVFAIGLLQTAPHQIDFILAIEDDRYLTPFKISMDDTYRPAVWCIKHKKSLIMNDFVIESAGYFGDIDQHPPTVGKNSGSVMYCPLLIGNKIIGTLTVQSYRLNAYNEEQQNMIQTLASTTAIALDNANAYAKIEQKNREIIDTQQQLVQAEKMASLGTLTAGVAHEINNPTNFVHVSAQNLEVDLARFQTFLFDLAGDDADEEILDSFRQQFAPLYDHLVTIKDGTQRIKVIVKDLRAFSQLESAEKKPAMISDLLQSTINLVQTQYKQVADFVTEFATVKRLECYPAQLNQVFMNLIVNACDAIQIRQQQQQNLKGKIVVTCKISTLDNIDKTDNLAGQQYIEVTIKDNGCGMTSDTKNKLFEPFYTTKAVGAGTGLGLSISFGIVQKHG